MLLGQDRGEGAANHGIGLGPGTPRSQVAARRREPRGGFAEHHAAAEGQQSKILFAAGDDERP